MQLLLTGGFAFVAGEEYHGYEPKWFRKEQDPQTGNVIHVFTNEYWASKEKQDWDRCPDIYLWWLGFTTRQCLAGF